MALTRDPPATVAAIAAGGFHPITLVFVDWPDDPVRVHSGTGTLNWGGHEWMGVGYDALNAALSLPSEAQGLTMAEGGAQIGGSPDLIDQYLIDAEDARNAEVQVWFGVTTARAGRVLIGDPFSVFYGSVGAVSDTEQWAGDIVERLIDLQLTYGPSQRARGSAYHTYEDQLRTDPADTAGRWVKQARADLAEGIPKW
ncbi:hypothetical protein [Roseicitreum antarcticum]|uniref:hypothetical protein n=1 Tax=Roseicitreum antarcticum TaxID=564137 RepID=UPI0016812561|nr:hypothetical protein [Roseicitreum antarcticum]